MEAQDLNAARQARYKSRLATSGKAQINLIAPSEAHATLKEIARRTRQGEDLSAVLLSLVQAPLMRGTEKLEMRTEALADRLAGMAPAPHGEVNIAVACASKASGSIRRKLKVLGLEYRERIFSGPVDAKLVDGLRRSVEATGGAMLANNCA